MMQKLILTVKENDRIADRVYRMTLASDELTDCLPGQFVDIALPGFYLRRPISVCDCSGGELTLVYKVVGDGTEYMSGLGAGVKLDVLTGLGNGYDLDILSEDVLLLGGGVGVPPLYMAAKRLVASGKKVRAVLGFNTAGEVFFEDEFRAAGADVTVVTADGSYGKKGFVTDVLGSDEPYYFACGPLPMLKAVYSKLGKNGQFSLEERMGCGFGACMGCSVMTLDGAKRVCRDGPVFKGGELAWD